MYCTGSATVLAEGAARVARVYIFYVRPTLMPHNLAETHENARRCVKRGHEYKRETASTLDESASNSDGLGSLCGSLLYRHTLHPPLLILAGNKPMYHPAAFETWPKINVFYNCCEAKFALKRCQYVRY